MITAEGERPQKRHYRSRAHCNPLSFNDSFAYPPLPPSKEELWMPQHDPNLPDSCPPAPDVLDIGCGFGGLTVALAKLLPTSTILGMEIRAKVTEYVRLRIISERKDSAGASHENASVIRSNSMKHLPNFFKKASITKMFFCFPDPHFKAKNHRRRIVSTPLLTEYAYFIAEGGLIYAITDVEDLHNWHLVHLRKHVAFRELSEEEMDKDPCVAAMKVETEEGQKVARAGSNKYYCVFERRKAEDIEKQSYDKLL
jgi:tRNA (guanine-N7-)-methyltransferase